MHIRSTTVQVSLAAFVLCAAAASTFGQSQRKVTQLAEGVYEIQHEPNGNTTVIIGERQVFVVDTCFLPSAAREDIAQIRQWTDKPVSFVLNTHFHNDHNFGNRAYMDEFPALTIIAHVETKKEMDRFGPSSARREEKPIATIQRCWKREKPGTDILGHDVGKASEALQSRKAESTDRLSRERWPKARTRGEASRTCVSTTTCGRTSRAIWTSRLRRWVKPRRREGKGPNR